MYQYGTVLYTVLATFRTQAPGSDKVVTKSSCGSRYCALSSTGKANVGCIPVCRDPRTLYSCNLLRLGPRIRPMTNLSEIEAG